MATASEDYTPVAQIVTFSSGSAEGEEQCIQVEILPDSIVESQESFALNLGSPGTLVAIQPGFSSTTVNIVNTDSRFNS